MGQTRWIRAFLLDELPVGDARVVRKGGAQVAVFRPGPDTLYAVANQCPHEGYPLARGYVTDCVVTCPWHNYKFDLRDGRCVLGDEDVRTFPVRVVGGAVELDVTEPDPEVVRPRLRASLEAGLLQRKLGQVARDVVRLLRVGATPADLALEAARFDATHAPYGTTHVLPLAVDALALADRFGGADAVLPLMQPLDLASEAHQRRSPRPVPAPVAPGPDLEAAGERLLALVRAEDGVAAEALLRGALAAGVERDVIERWLYRLCADHFLDFGHALIYQVKIFDLLDRVGWSHASALLPAHLCGIVNGTREDTLPEWEHFRRRLVGVEDELPAWIRTDRAAGPVDRDAIATALCGGDRDAGYDAVIEALRSGALEQVVDGLALAAAERILRFDVGIDADPTVQEGWLDVTHLLTYANALRHAVRRYHEPPLARLILYGVRFVTTAAALELPAERRLSIDPGPAPGSPAAGARAVIDAIRGRDGARAASAAAAYLRAGLEPTPLRQAVEDAMLDDPLTRPIVVAHAIKTCAAAFEEQAAMARPEPVIALARFLASPVRERPVARLSHEAVRFVVEGRVPRTLT
jgi:nitrite reductase/ring-hydroxylating ferredoxin subunit